MLKILEIKGPMSFQCILWISKKRRESLVSSKTHGPMRDD